MLRKGPRDRTRGRIKRKNRDKRKEKGTREETRALNFMPPLLISKLIERQTKIVFVYNICNTCNDGVYL